MDVFDRWTGARADAQRQANVYRRTMGIERAEEFGGTVYRVKMLPKPAQRQGWELRCETVEPDAGSLTTEPEPV
jgi:hypothetical protein